MHFAANDRLRAAYRTSLGSRRCAFCPFFVSAFLTCIVTVQSFAPRVIGWQEQTSETAPKSLSASIGKDWYQDVSRDDVRASSFQDVTPGKTTLDELISLLNDPVSRSTQGQEEILVYKVGPFPKVEMILSNDVVTSVIVHLAAPATVQETAVELGLQAFTAAPIEGEGEESLGVVYPERGIALGFSDKKNADEQLVSELILEPVSAETFLLRAKNGPRDEYLEKLADLNFAAKMDPQNYEIQSFKAQLLASCFEYNNALLAIETALESDPDNLFCRMTRARIKFEISRFEEASQEAGEIAVAGAAPVIVRAKARNLLGDILANQGDRDYEKAIEHHLAAIELVAPLATHEDPKKRREAKVLLIQIHLSVANDITHGEWRGKEETGPKWLRTSRELVDDYMQNEDGDPLVQLQLFRDALRSYLGMKGAVDPEQVVGEARKVARTLLKESSDPLRQQQIKWLLVESLFDATRICQIREERESLLHFAEEAADFLSEFSNRDSIPRSDYLVGRLYFYVGATYSITDQDHEKAVRWYERALEFLENEIPPGLESELGSHGERFVSMGVSYWQVDAKKEAIRLTEHGLKLMEQAQQDGSIEDSSLAVPYGNLAAMYKALGRIGDATRNASKAARLERASKPQSD